jgi:hypothetical protein
MLNEINAGEKLVISPPIFPPFTVLSLSLTFFLSLEQTASRTTLFSASHGPLSLSCRRVRSPATLAAVSVQRPLTFRGLLPPPK